MQNARRLKASGFQPPQPRGGCSRSCAHLRSSPSRRSECGGRRYRPDHIAYTFARSMAGELGVDAYRDHVSSGLEPGSNMPRPCIRDSGRT
jgi:hypothetical protein